MGEKYIIGIDSGTQSTRVSIFTQKGERVAIGNSNHPGTTCPQQGWHEHGKSDFWDALCNASTKAFEKFKGNKEDIVGIAIASQRYCMNILDSEGNIIHNPISWMDNRWMSNYQTLGPMPDDIENPFYKSFLPYLSLANWMKHNRPEVYADADKYMNVSGYLGYKLTGEFKDSISNNIGWPYDEIAWEGFTHDRYIELMGFRPDQLAQPILPGQQIGDISAQAAQLTGLPQGCPLYASGGDKQCELLGAGVVKHGQAYITLGTLSGMDVVSDCYTPSGTFAYATYLAAYPKRYNYESQLGKGFWLVSWFRENFGMDLAAEAKEKNISIEALLDSEADAIPAGSEGLVVLPDWSPGSIRQFSKGMFIGFDDRHKRGHVYRALVEGIIMEIKAKSDYMVNDLGMDIEELYIGGGGSRSNFCSQAIADVFNVPVYRSRESENSSLGTAMCAAVGCGLYPNFTSSIDGMVKDFDVFTPNPENHLLYTQLESQVISKLYPALEDLMKNLVSLTSAQTAT